MTRSRESIVANNTNNGMISMSMRELDRLKVIEAVVEGRLMPWRAAERLKLSRRQVERLAESLSPTRSVRPGIAQARSTKQSSVTGRSGGARPGHHPRALRRFWADAPCDLF